MLFQKIAVFSETGELLSDCDIRVENGTISERGTHDELLKNGGYYAQVFEHQYGKEAMTDGQK